MEKEKNGERGGVIERIAKRMAKSDRKNGQEGNIAKRRESCKIFATSTQVTQAKITYVIDTTMRDIARVIKKFEFKMIGSRLEKTRQ